MAIEAQSVQIESIRLQEIGNSIDRYDLQAGKIKASDLTEIGSADANLSNGTTPFDIHKTSFYHAGVTFTTNAAYPDGLFFTLSLVSTDKEHPLTKAVMMKNVFVYQSGKHTFYGDFLVPDDLKEGKYLLVAKVSNDQLDSLVSKEQKITKIPQIGAVYVDIGNPTEERKGYVLDINTTRHIDTPYNGHFLYFADNFLQQESGKGRFLFSNVGTTEIQVVISATLRLKNGGTIQLGLLDPENKKIENSVTLTLPAVHELSLDNLINISTIQLKPQISLAGKRAQQKPPGMTTPEIEERLKDVQAIQRQMFIPLAQNKAAKGEKRYSVTLGYYIPKKSYADILDFSSDFALSRSVEPSEGTVEWKIRFLDSQTLQQMAGNIQMLKIANGISSWAESIEMQSTISLIEQMPKPIDAALVDYSKSAYVFSNDMYSTINPDTGELTGEWKKTSELFGGGSVLFAYPMTAAVRIGTSTFLFFKNSQQYIEYDNLYHRIEKVEMIKDMNPTLFLIPNPGSVGKCLSDHLDLTKLDAAFRDDWDVYFIAGDDYVQIAENETTHWHECKFGKVSDREEWNVKSGMPITAVLSDYKQKRGRLRFFLNGITSGVVLNKPDVFKDERNSFDQEVGDSDVASLKLYTGYGIQARWVVPGVHGYANADLDLYLFGYPLKLFSANAEAYGSVGKLHPYAEEGSVAIKVKSGTNLHLEMLGSIFVDSNKISEIDVTAKIDPGNVKQSCARSPIPEPYFDGDALVSWEETYEVFNIRIPAGPIMLSVAGGIDGSLKITAPIVVEDHPENLSESVSIKPSINTDMGAYMTGGVDYALVKAGVKGDVRIAETGVAGELNARLFFDEQKTSIDFDVTAKIAGHLRLVRAALLLYAGTKTHIKWCSSWGVPYPCGLGWDIWDIPIYETPWLYNYEPTLLDTTLVGYEIPLK